MATLKVLNDEYYSAISIITDDGQEVRVLVHTGSLVGLLKYAKEESMEVEQLECRTMSRTGKIGTTADGAVW